MQISPAEVLSFIANTVGNKFVVSASGRVHVVDLPNAGVTACGWTWTHSKDAVIHDTEPQGIWCLRCASAREPKDTDTESASAQSSSFE